MAVDLDALQADLRETNRHRDALVSENEQLKRDLSGYADCKEALGDAQVDLDVADDKTASLESEVAARDSRLATLEGEVKKLAEKAAKYDAVRNALL